MQFCFDQELRICNLPARGCLPSFTLNVQQTAGRLEGTAPPTVYVGASSSSVLQKSCVSYFKVIVCENRCQIFRWADALKQHKHNDEFTVQQTQSHNL